MRDYQPQTSNGHHHRATPNGSAGHHSSPLSRATHNGTTLIRVVSAWPTSCHSDAVKPLSSAPPRHSNHVTISYQQPNLFTVTSHHMLSNHLLHRHIDSSIRTCHQSPWNRRHRCFTETAAALLQRKLKNTTLSLQNAGSTVLIVSALRFLFVRWPKP